MTTLFNCLLRVQRHGIRPFVLVLMLVLVACTNDSSTPYNSVSISENDIALNNRGVALMGRFDYRSAVDLYEELVERQPQWHEVRTNLAIALKNRQDVDDGQAALDQLAIVLDAQPHNVRANYVAGVLQLYLGRIDSAAAYFKVTLAIDPEDAYAHYYFGQCQLRSGDVDAALASYQKSIELDPYLRSAYYSAAQVLRRLGRDTEATEQLALFQRFENNPRARLAEFKYTRMGPKSLAMVVGVKVATDAPPTIPQGPLFADKRIVAELGKDNRNEGFKGQRMTTVDLDQDGYQDLFLTGEAGAENRLLLSTQNTKNDLDFIVQLDHPWRSIQGINAVAWGDTDNDGLVDVYLCRSGPNQLWLQSPAGKWSRAGVEANVDDGTNDCADATMVDADHDGDLDILIGNRGAGDNLLNNNRDGTFRSLAANLGDAAKPGNTRHLITTDIDADGDVDLIFVHETPPHVVLINDRLWNYAEPTGLEVFQNTSINSLAAVDLDADGVTELLSVDDAGELNIWQSSIQGKWHATTVLRSGLATEMPVDLVPLDLNGNGNVELVLLAEGAFEVIGLRYKENTSGGLQKSWDGISLKLERYNGSKAIPVTRSTHGSSLIALAGHNDQTALLEWAPGSGRFEFATLTFSGKHDAAQTMRSNHSGIGTTVSVRTGSRWSIGDTHKHSSLQGYSLQPISIGLGGQQKADFVAVDWSDGVFQTELDMVSGSIHAITEEQRQLGSCPVLFAWNGKQFSFVTDILGVAAQGFLVEPGTLLPPRPWERITFAPGSLLSDNGSLKFKLTEPMQENSYIDALTLESYDLPTDWKIIVDERMGAGPPEVTGETMFYRQAISPVSAFDGAGNDVHTLILKHDQQAMSPGRIDRRYIGLLEEPESLTIEFDAPINHLVDRPEALPVLVAESWLELPYSQTHFSAWQAGNQYRSVSLEARDSNDEWHSVYPEFGIPAGMPRVVSLPLRTLPQGTVALRLSWNREIYWDRIRVVYTESPPAEMHHQSLLPSFARVAKSGFSRRITHPQRRAEYIYQQRTPFGDVKYPTGFYTSLGEMTELVTSADDALAIIGPGEEIHVEFENAAPPPAELQRWYVLETRGWAKDKDMYTYQGNTVGPLPRASSSAAHRVDNTVREALHQKYNTRFQSGQ